MLAITPTCTLLHRQTTGNIFRLYTDIHLPSLNFDLHNLTRILEKCSIISLEFEVIYKIIFCSR